MNDRFVFLAVWPHKELVFGLWWSHDKANVAAQRFERRCAKHGIKPQVFVLEILPHESARAFAEQLGALPDSMKDAVLR